MPIELRIPKFHHKERHVHHCPIHARNKCKHNEHLPCNACLFQEDNEVCQKTLRGTNLSYHTFPCLGCVTHYRNHFGGEVLVDALVSLEQAARAAHHAPDAHVDEREDREAETDPEVKRLADARKRV